MSLQSEMSRYQFYGHLPWGKIPYYFGCIPGWNI
jgi:hypothetical protein